MNPRLTEAEVKLTATFARHVDQFVRGEAAQRLWEDVAPLQLHRGAQQFNTTAASKLSRGLVAVLGKLESPGASEDHARAADLRRRLADAAAATVPNLRQKSAPRAWG